MKEGMQVRNNVRLARIEKGYTQQELADLVEKKNLSSE